MKKKEFDIPYMMRVLAEIYGREHGVNLTVTITPKEFQEKK